jgi:hypothetical protein
MVLTVVPFGYSNTIEVDVFLIPDRESGQARRRITQLLRCSLPDDVLRTPPASGAAGQHPVAASAYSPRHINTWAQADRLSASRRRQHNRRLPQLRSLVRDISGDYFSGPRASGWPRTVAAGGCVQINPAPGTRTRGFGVEALADQTTQ